MRTILRDNYNPEVGDYHESLVVDEANEKIWLFDCDGVFTKISSVKVVSTFGDSEEFAASQKLVTGVHDDLTTEVTERKSADNDIWTEVGIINGKIEALATDFSYKGSVADYAHLPSDAATGDCYTTLDTGIIYVWDGTQWVALNEYPSVFVGTDGTNPGAAGLVPAPLATDIHKILSSNGTWIPENITVLTADDMNEPSDNPVRLAPWYLPMGIYKLDSSRGNITVRIGGYSAITTDHDGYLVVMGTDTTPIWRRWIVAVDPVSPNRGNKVYLSNTWYDHAGSWSPQGGNSNLTYADNGAILSTDSLITTLTDSTSNANYNPTSGSAVRGYVSKSIKRGNGAPTSSTPGEIGTIYEDYTNAALYYCTNVSGSGTSVDPYVYTWGSIATGSVPTVVQTTGDSTTSVMSQDATSRMIFRTRGAGYPWDPTYYVDYINIGGKDTQTTVLADGWGINIGGYGNGGTSREISDASVTIGHGTYAAGRGDVIIGNPGSTGINSNLTNSVVIGNGAGPSGSGASLYRNSLVTIGYKAQVPTQSITGAVAIGACSYAQANGEMNIGSTNTTYGYNSSNYRLLTGLYDPQSAHDAATKGYVDTAVGGAVATINSTDWSALWQ